MSQPPPAAMQPAAMPAAPRCRSQLVLALAVVAGVLAGAVVTAVLVTAAFISAAEEIGRGMSQGLGSDLGRSVGQSVARSVPDGAAGAVTEQPVPDSRDVRPVQLHAPVAPAGLGRDPVLDAHAESCFNGDYGRCDDLFAEARPLSDYERYGVTCAGRVKPYDVATCTVLD